MLNAFTSILRTFVQSFVLFIMIINIHYSFINTKIPISISLISFITLVLSTLLMNILKPHLYDIITFAILFILNMVFFGENLKLAFASSMLTSALFYTCLNIIANLFSIFTNVFANITVCLLVASLLFTLVSIPIQKYIHDNINKISLVLQEMTLPLFITIVVYTTIIRTLMRVNLGLSDFILVQKIVFILCESISSLSFIYYFIETKYSKMQSDIVTNNMNNTIDKLRVIKHDYDNILQCINGYIVTKQYDGLNYYISELTNETKDIDYNTGFSEELIHQPALFGVLSAKYHIALSKKIDFNIKIDTDLSLISYNKAKLSRIIGILLDNAIEASEKTKNKKVIIHIGEDKDTNSTFIQVKNSVLDKNIDINNIFEKGVSSKKIKSGIGLWEVKKLVNAAPNSHIITNIKDNLFSQTLVINNV